MLCSWGNKAFSSNVCRIFHIILERGAADGTRVVDHIKAERDKKYYWQIGSVSISINSKYRQLRKEPITIWISFCIFMSVKIFHCFSIPGYVRKHDVIPRNFFNIEVC